ncbi:MAG: hypothetical protein WAV05_04485 [Anaerolineales bacterium]
MEIKVRNWFLLFILVINITNVGDLQQNSISNQKILWENYDEPLISGGVISQIIIAPDNNEHLIALQEQTDNWQTIAESKNGGKLWSTLVNLHQFGIQYLDIDFDYPNILYASGDTGIYRSDDGGYNWQKLTNYGPIISVPSSKTIYSIEKLEGTLECPSGQTNFVRSVDGGNTWEAILLKCGIYGYISSSYSNPAVIYLNEIDPNRRTITLARSVDRGNSWSYTPLVGPYFTMGLFPIYIDPQISDKLYSSSGNGIIISEDGGQTWYSKLEVPISGAFLFSFTKNKIYAILNSTLVGSYGCIYRSDDEGETWKILSFPHEGNPIAILATYHNFSSRIFVSIDGFGIEKSTDGGLTWRISNRGLVSTTKTARLVFPYSPYMQIFTLIDWPRKALFTSSDDGLSWNLLKTENNLNDLAIDPIDSNLMWIVGDRGLEESKDGGKKWRSVSSLSGSKLSISPNSSNRPCSTHNENSQGFIVCREVSKNGNVTWQSYLVPGSKSLTDIAISPNDGSLIFVSGTSDYIYGSIYQSEDSGNNWRESLRSLANYYPLYIAISQNEPATIIAIFDQIQFDDLLIYESLDFGITWRDITSDIKIIANDLSTRFTFRAVALFDTSNTLYIATGNTIFSRLTPYQPWKIFGLINDRIYEAAINHGDPEYLWLAGETTGWRTLLPMYFYNWLPAIRR